VFVVVADLWVGEVDDQSDLVEQDKLLVLSNLGLTLAVCWSPTKKPSNSLRPPTDYILNVYYKPSNLIYSKINNHSPKIHL
jgi:hypothetical protein